MAATSHDVFDTAAARRRYGRLRTADVAAMRVGINVQRCAVAPPRRHRATSPMTSVASRGFEVGAVPAGSAGDVLPSRRVRARRRERATISDRRGGLAAASCDAGRPHGRTAACSTQPRRHQRGRATGCSPGGRRCRHRRGGLRHAAALLSQRRRAATGRRRRQRGRARRRAGDQARRSRGGAGWVATPCG